MNVETTLETNAWFSEAGKPGMCALDHPAMSSKSPHAFYPFSGYTSPDSALLQVTPTAGKVVALVSVQFARAVAGLAIQSRHRRGN
ncbi:hypothetical protein LMG27177_06336 [Paraburkholderia fynbosensis]|uniref:Uncharacterized protein n=1 Tax=Paraburkholderia fynbosensis TaxID=1200993 RepID=A0A6J5GV38_9BURK|nr:hypothetical protein LMG27177_06336 [Paraburkholderia fynbosensis]